MLQDEVRSNQLKSYGDLKKLKVTFLAKTNHELSCLRSELF